MKKEILEALIKLFSIISVQYRKLSKEESLNFIEIFLETEYHLENIIDYYDKIDYNLTYYQNTENTDNEDLIALCESIKEKLPKKMRVLILIHVMQFLKFSGNTQNSLFSANEESNAAKIIADIFNIEEDEYIDFAAFISNTLHKVRNKNRLLIISPSNLLSGKVNFIERKELQGKITFIYIKSVNLYLFTYNGEDELLFNENVLYNRHLYVFSHNSVIGANNISKIYYSELIAAFSSDFEKSTRIEFEAKNINFTFRNSTNGIHNLNLEAKSFEFVGIMGGSGSGKTTLLNILNGNIEPQEGELLVNGKSFHDFRNELKSIIGYVPQDDSLIEELTVYENLYFMGKFCYSNYSEAELSELVNNLLIELDLHDVKDLKVGSILNKLISGGQRKRLNIALELIREPQILLVDEPTSGLSSADAERIVYLMAEQVTKGRLVITNIHQPSSDIFKLFDKLIILDKGGFPVYIGSPAEVFDYFRKKTERIDIFKNFTKHGYFIPEEIFRLLEEKKLDEFGEVINERLRTPEEWHRYYIEGRNDNVASNVDEKKHQPLPKTNLRKPVKISQTLIYFKRNFKAKLGDKQYMLISTLIAPILAIILGYFTKNTNLNEELEASYVFSLNENLPSFFFMSVIVSLFIGLIVSAEEIIDDRKLLLRESFLNLSRSAYLHSKIFFLILLSFVQTTLYVVLSILILKIPDMSLKLFLILFSISCFANILGLVISASMRSVIAIYITIPLIIIPQLLLSGVVVDYEDLHYSISSPKYTPLVGDLMASRWGLEALMVEQFKNNEYEKIFYETEKKISDYSFINYHVIPIINNKLSDCKLNYNTKSSEVIRNGLAQITSGTMLKVPVFKNFSEITEIERAENFLKKGKEYLSKEISSLVNKKDLLVVQTVGNFESKDEFLSFKSRHLNEAVSRVVKRDNMYSAQIIIHKNQLIRKSEPIFHTPENNFGRAQFYSPTKKIANYSVDTYWFNVILIWLMWLFFYITLMINSPEKINAIINKLKN